MAHKYRFNGGPLTGCTIEGEFPGKFPFPEKLILEYAGAPTEEIRRYHLLDADTPLTVGSYGYIAEYEFDRDETGEFHFAEGGWSFVKVDKADDGENKG